jgi:hypothetical protein
MLIPLLLILYVLLSKALERYSKTGSALKCKSCTAAQEERERLAAAAKQASRASAAVTTTLSSSEIGGAEQDVVLNIMCCSCKKSLSASDFNRNQLAKRDKARCRNCVQKSIDEEEQNRNSCREQKIHDLQEKLELMNVKGDIKGRLKYESELSALEAEHVTGLKPMVLGKGGRGSWRRRTAGRGR